MEGKVVGKVTEEELEQLKDFKRRDDAIYKMVEKLTAQQYQLELEQEQWFIAIRAKYGVNTDAGITIKHDTGKIYEIPQNSNQ
jgi:hypothetical protein